ncbi:MAG: single-stranded-DNA-specific exonuclease RecJ [Luteibaculum sp.]
MDKRWSPIPEADAQEVKQLGADLNISLKLAQILCQRGIKSFQEAKQFFRPKLADLHNPFLMKDMLSAVNLLGSAMEEGKKILIYGDYDVDGTTAVALVYGYLKQYGAQVEFYIPDRYKEGYGVSMEGIDYCIKNSVDLLITLDCGIKAINTLEKAAQAGIKIIVCDHHLPGESLPPADAILNPKQANCPYPFKELCGCGVGFKLLQGLAKQYDLEKEILYHHIDLVAIATAADIVPMVGENRVLTALGLKQLNKGLRPGINAMLQGTRSDNRLGVSELVFFIAPRINAAGRIFHGKEAVKLLSAGDEKSAELAQQLQSLNDERKTLDRSIAEEALNQIIEQLEKNNTTVVYQEDWHKGVVGIVASRLTENYYRPTVVMCKAEGKITGSVRSVEGFDVYQALRGCADLLEQFGGHTSAAGLTMQEENLDAFRMRFEEVVSQQINPELLIPQVHYDCELDFKDVDPKFYRIVEQMAPFGPENLRPQFLFKNVQDTGFAKIVGENHLKMNLFQEEWDHKKMPAIAFKLGQHIEMVKTKQPFHVIASIEENHWNGRSSLQLVVKDIKQTL